MKKVIHKKNARHVTKSGVHVARRPGSILIGQLKKRLAKKGWKHRVFDIAAIVVIAAMIIVGLWQLFAADPGRRVEFTAVVAPETVVSGGESTLSISYTNKSRETLENVALTLTYPPYFVLQDIDHPEFEATTNTIEIGDLAPGANGLVKVRGVMFGDVGGTQKFESTLSYTWHETKTGARDRSYSFSPQSSALAIETQLPDRLVSGQRISGEVRLENTGPVTFPEAAIRAVFPDGFDLRQTSLAQREDNTWVVPQIEPGDELLIEYAGNLSIDNNEEAQFLFEPSFVFGDERFIQDTLEETVSTVPPPVDVSISGVPEVLTAGVSIPVTIEWTDQSDLAIKNAKIRIEGATNEPEWDIDTPVVAGSREASLIPHAGGGTERSAAFTPIIEFELEETGDPVTVVGATQERKITTSVSLGGFARYFTSAGDQLGRGPLPPQVGEETIYWVFINAQHTFNDVENAVLTAKLPSNVSWIDKQSVTKGSSVAYNAGSHSISWSIGNLEATLSNGSIAAASFALGITPSSDQAGSIPALLQNVRFEGLDSWTRQSVVRNIGTISTQISEDSGIVR